MGSLGGSCCVWIRWLAKIDIITKLFVPNWYLFDQKRLTSKHVRWKKCSPWRGALALACCCFRSSPNPKTASWISSVWGTLAGLPDWSCPIRRIRRKPLLHAAAPWQRQRQSTRRQRTARRWKAQIDKLLQVRRDHLWKCCEWSSKSKLTSLETRLSNRAGNDTDTAQVVYLCARARARDWIHQWNWRWFFTLNSEMSRGRVKPPKPRCLSPFYLIFVIAACPPIDAFRIGGLLTRWPKLRR